MEEEGLSYLGMKTQDGNIYIIFYFYDSELALSPKINELWKLVKRIWYQVCRWYILQPFFPLDFQPNWERIQGFKRKLRAWLRLRAKMEHLIPFPPNSADLPSHNWRSVGLPNTKAGRKPYLYYFSPEDSKEPDTPQSPWPAAQVSKRQDHLWEGPSLHQPCQ